MPLTVICARCQQPILAERQLRFCPHCQRPIGAAAYSQLETALAREEAPKPLLLRLGQFGSGVVGGMLIVSLGLMAGNLTDVSIGTARVSPVVAALVALPVVGLAGICLAVSVGLRRERPWARPLMLAYWVVGGTFTFALKLFESNAAVALIETAIATALPSVVAYWYLYNKENVVAYYRALELEDES